MAISCFNWIVHHESKIECIITSRCPSNLDPAVVLQVKWRERGRSLINFLYLAEAREFVNYMIKFFDMQTAVNFKS